jgi:predicted nucleic acid-binding protein
MDTNVLLRLSKEDDPHYALVRSATEALIEKQAHLCYAPQNISEFWNVCTRPGSHNGFGLSIKETDVRVCAIERIMTLLPDNEQIYWVWRDLVVNNSVSGVQVHDARLAAAMQVHAIPRILTLNQPDFARYTNIQVVHPRDVQV